MKIIITIVETLYSDKLLSRVKLFKTLKGAALKLGIIGVLLIFSFGLIFLAGIVALFWLILQNI